MAGRTDTMVRRLEREMTEASEQLEFERAARLRDDVAALRRAMEKQTVVLGDGTDADVVAFADDPLEAAVQVFHVRDGRVRGQRGWVVEKTEELTTGDLVHHFCTQVYGGEQGEADVPRELLVPELPADADALADWLSARRGSRVSPAGAAARRQAVAAGDRGAQRQGRAGPAQAQAGRRPDHPQQGPGRDQRGAGMRTSPLRIECFDVSQIQGTDVVASMVRLRGRAAPQERVPPVHRPGRHRRPLRHVRGAAPPLRPLPGRPRRDRRDGRGDRRPTRTGPGIDPTTGRPRKFAYPPQLVVVDGGAPQVAAAAQALAELGIDDVALCGLAKRLEEVWLPDDEFPVILPRTSEGLYLLQRVRDEAHRFAITFHRQRRSKRMTESALDDVPGLGEVRRKALLRHFGSLKRLSAATVEEITEVPGVGRRTAEAILAALDEAPRRRRASRPVPEYGRPYPPILREPAIAHLFLTRSLRSRSRFRRSPSSCPGFFDVAPRPATTPRPRFALLQRR